MGAWFSQLLRCTKKTRASNQWGTDTLASAITWCIKNINSMKHRSLWPTSSLRSNSSHIHSFIPNFHEALKVQGKITGSWNICQRDILYYEVKGWAILTHYPKLSFSYIKPSSRYMAKSLYHEIEVTKKHGHMEGWLNERKEENYLPLYILGMPGVLSLNSEI